MRPRVHRAAVACMLLAAIPPAYAEPCTTPEEGNDVPVVAGLPPIPSCADIDAKGDAGGSEPADTVAISRSDSLVFVPAARFRYADAPRATLYGPLPLAETHIDPVRASIVGGVFAGVLVGMHLNMSSAWWTEGSTFHLKNDWDDVLQVDKAGHAFAGYLMSYALSEALTASGIGWGTAAFTGALLGLAYQTYVELEDGYAEGWGFSLTDMGANTFGTALFLAQYHVPFLQNFTPKYQYVPASWVNVPHLSTTWIDNYNSSTFWLSANMHNLLPASVRDVWPSWLALAVGYGVTISESERSRRVVLALDYDLVKLLPEGGHVWNWFRQSLNFIKLPAPALQLAPHPRFYLLFPFTVSIGSLRM